MKNNHSVPQFKVGQDRKQKASSVLASADTLNSIKLKGGAEDDSK